MIKNINTYLLTNDYNFYLNKILSNYLIYLSNIHLQIIVFKNYMINKVQYNLVIQYSCGTFGR